MEREGFKVDEDHMRNIERQAVQDRNKLENQFLEFVYANQEDAKEFNPTSVQQMQHFLFAPFKKQKAEAEKLSFEECLEKDLAVPQVRTFRVENISQEIREGKETPLKFRDMKIKGFGIPPVEFTASGMPSADTNVISQLTGNPEEG